MKNAPGADAPARTAAAAPSPPPEGDRYQPVSARRRVLLALMAVAVAITVIPYMVRHWGLVRAFQATVPVCAAGQSEACVGGKVGVIAVPPATAASAPR